MRDPLIRNPLLLAISGILLLVAIFSYVERKLFLGRAERTIGIVTEVAGENDWPMRRISRRSTQFTAKLEYVVAERTYWIEVSAGRSRGWDRPISEADYQRGSQVPVLYDPSDPRDAYRDELADVWKMPLWTLFFQIATLIGSLSEGKRS